ncbi:hypothetical protein A2U01_0062847, partial [Trifolium medium]|nr:hypothetical protein [Trifolium medium]
GSPLTVHVTEPLQLPVVQLKYLVPGTILHRVRPQIRPLAKPEGSLIVDFSPDFKTIPVSGILEAGTAAVHTV